MGAPLWLGRKHPHALAVAIHDDQGDLTPTARSGDRRHLRGDRLGARTTALQGARHRRAHARATVRRLERGRRSVSSAGHATAALHSGVGDALSLVALARGSQLRGAWRPAACDPPRSDRRGRQPRALLARGDVAEKGGAVVRRRRRRAVCAGRFRFLFAGEGAVGFPHGSTAVFADRFGRSGSPARSAAADEGRAVARGHGGRAVFAARVGFVIAGEEAVGFPDGSAAVFADRRGLPCSPETSPCPS